MAFYCEKSWLLAKRKPVEYPHGMLVLEKRLQRPSNVLNLSKKIMYFGEKSDKKLYMMNSKLNYKSLESRRMVKRP